MYVLKLYILGKTPELEKNIDKLKRVLEENYESDYSLTVVDLMENPQLAEEDAIFATPTLIKKLPGPVKKIIGDLSDSHKMLVGLQMADRS